VVLTDVDVSKFQSTAAEQRHWWSAASFAGDEHRSSVTLRLNDHDWMSYATGFTENETVYQESLRDRWDIRTTSDHIEEFAQSWKDLFVRVCRGKGKETRRVSQGVVDISMLSTPTVLSTELGM